jgi:hypothetical protein
MKGTMSNPHVVPFLARKISNPIAQETLLSAHPHAAESLASNVNLHDDVWFKLVKKSKVPVVAALASQTLTDARLEAILKDKRVTVRNAIINNGLRECTSAMADQVLSSGWFEPQNATMWLVRNTVPATHLKHVALIENSNGMVARLADATLFSDKEAARLMVSARFKGNRAPIQHLLDRRPELVAEAAKAGSDNLHVLEAAAGSRHLFDSDLFELILGSAQRAGGSSSGAFDVMMSLIANPNTPNTIIDTALESLSHHGLRTWSRFRPVSNAAIVDAVRQRRLRNPGLGPLTVAWETTSDLEKSLVLESINNLSINRYPTLVEWNREQRGYIQPQTSSNANSVKVVEQTVPDVTPETLVLSDSGAQHKFNLKEIVSTIENELSPHGANAWVTFWTLIEDWQGTLRELIDTTIGLTK